MIEPATLNLLPFELADVQVLDGLLNTRQF